jgi:DNA-directed RNA polymerase specialized sigma24 family protein
MQTHIPFHAYAEKHRWIPKELERLQTPSSEEVLRSWQKEIDMDALDRHVRALVRDALSFDEWEVYFYRYIDLPYKRIAQITGRSEGSLRQCWHTGLQKLRKAAQARGLEWPEA